MSYCYTIIKIKQIDWLECRTSQSRVTDFFPKIIFINKTEARSMHVTLVRSKYSTCSSLFPFVWFQGSILLQAVSANMLTDISVHRLVDSRLTGRSTCQPTDGVSRLGGISVKCRWSIGQVSVVYQPSVGSLLVKCLNFISKYSLNITCVVVYCCSVGIEKFDQKKNLI